jgi:hypothetical protein
MTVDVFVEIGTKGSQRHSEYCWRISSWMIHWIKKITVVTVAGRKDETKYTKKN